LSRTNQKRAPQSASGTSRSRNRRRQQGGVPAWVRPFCRANYALEASVRLLGSTARIFARSERCAHHRPVRTARNLLEATMRLRDASERLIRAAKELAETKRCVAREPVAGILPELLDHTDARWREILVSLAETAEGVFTLHEDVLFGLETGALVPERQAERRPRIRLAPRPVTIRDFLLLRQARVVDRIAPILRRRRRTPRPASVRVPQRSLLGRAPPLF
jgi:hypothetical protein